jgi:nucleoside-diphosphate-sugar epimerase
MAAGASGVKSPAQGPVLVTGGTGFIGRSVINALLSSGFAGHVLSFSLPGEAAPSAWGTRVEVLRGDIADAAAVAAAVRGSRTVIHLAALLGAGGYDAHRRITVGGTRHVLAAALAEGARVVVVSSVAVYGEQVRTRVCGEDVGYGPHLGPYSQAKQEQERLAWSYAERGLAVTVVRPANVYGVGSVPWVDVVVAALRARAPLLVDGGGGNAGLVHVANLADALVLAARDRAAVGCTYNVCDDLPVSWQRYFGDIAAAIGVELPPSATYSELHQAARKDEQPEEQVVPAEYRSIPLATLALIGSDNRYPTGKIRRLGWAPKVGYSEAMAEIAVSLAKRSPLLPD